MLGAAVVLALGALAETGQKSNPLEPYKAPMQCPGSAMAPPGAYAWAHVTTDFEEDCDTVRKEIEARAKMEDGWTDPHNGGTYKLNGKTSDDKIVTDHYTGNFPHFHDTQNIVLVAGSKRKFDFMVRNGKLPKDAELAAAGGCMLYGCSDSQGVSAADGSTNYCNIHNLYANEDKDNVAPVNTNLNYHEEKKTSQLGSMDTQVKNCNTMSSAKALPAPKKHEVEGTPGEPFSAPMKCPGSALAPPFAYAWAHVVVDIDQDCDTVRKEMESRANMEDGWTDPHNGGKYDVAKDSSDSMLVVDHYTGNFPHFHDKVNFVFESRRRRAESSGSAGCTVYACSDSQGVSAADGSTNYCNIHNLYANEDKDGVAAVNTNLTYKEKKKASQLGPMDLDVRNCNTEKFVRDNAAEQRAKHFKNRVDSSPGHPSEPYKSPMKCPGSMAPDFAYAWAHTTAEFDEDCATVKSEMEARAKMEDGWKDPHNGGTYKLNSASSGNTIVTDHYTHNAPHFHDKQMLTLVDGSMLKFREMVRKGLIAEDAELTAAGGCTVYACSDSQGISAADGSTNYCNVHNLYANEKKDGVKPVNTDLTYKETKRSSQLGPMDTDSRACNTEKVGSSPGHPSEPYKAPMQCPGSQAPDFAYAWAHTTAEFDEDCATVKSEMEARAKMEDGWKDPHNGGKYQLNSKTSGNTVVTDHYTGNAPHFHDRQMLTLVDGSMRKWKYFVAKGLIDETAELAAAGGCTVYACSDSQGPSAADGSTNYCDVHNLYANEDRDGVKPVKTDLTYHETKKSSQLGALDTDVRQCNTMKAVVEDDGYGSASGSGDDKAVVKDDGYGSGDDTVKAATPENMCCDDGCGTNGWQAWTTKDKYCPMACGYCYHEGKVKNTPGHPSEPYKSPMKCPGSMAPDFAYAWAHTTAEFDEDCATVKAEMEARAKMEDGWKDPHNGGTYKLNSKTSGNTVVTDHYTHNAPHFHDKQMLTLVDGSYQKYKYMIAMGLLPEDAEFAAAGGCTVYACSDSQGISAADGSTNYCNVHNLYANEKQDKVKPVNTDLNYHETRKSSQLGAMDTDVRACNTEKFGEIQAQPKKAKTEAECIYINNDIICNGTPGCHWVGFGCSSNIGLNPVATPGEPTQNPMKCPGSAMAPPFAYAWAHVVVDFDEDCDTVRKEMEARAKMEDGWTDPHNGGKYDVAKNSSDSMLVVDHYTGNFPHFHDKVNFVYESRRRRAESSGSAGCTVYACSDSQGVSAADGSTNYCNIHNLYANESKDNVKPVNTDLTYKEKKKTSQLGSMDTQTKACNTESAKKKTLLTKLEDRLSGKAME